LIDVVAGSVMLLPLVVFAAVVLLLSLDLVVPVGYNTIHQQTTKIAENSKPTSPSLDRHSSVVKNAEPGRCVQVLPVSKNNRRSTIKPVHTAKTK
jgi:hypothetical protein